MGTSTKKIAGARRLLAGAAIAAAIAGAGIAASGTASAFPGGMGICPGGGADTARSAIATASPIRTAATTTPS